MTKQYMTCVSYVTRILACLDDGLTSESKNMLNAWKIVSVYMKFKIANGVEKAVERIRKGQL